jgi:hypothetical protein
MALASGWRGVERKLGMMAKSLADQARDFSFSPKAENLRRRRLKHAV